MTHERRAPNFEWLRAFVVFAEHVNFTSAARALHLSQPALHAQVNKLSEQLGAELYRRRGRGLELTPEGVRTLAFGRELLERSERFFDELRGVASARPLVLAAGEGALLYLIGERLRRAIEEDLRIQTLVRDGAGVIDAVQSGLAQVGVTVLDEVPPELSARGIRRAGHLLVVPRGHRLAARRRLSLEHLDGLPLVAPPAGARQRDMLESFARAAGARVQVAVEARGWPLTLRLVELGAGAAVVNDVVRIPKSLVAIRLRGLPPQTYWSLRRGEASHSPSARRLWSILHQPSQPVDGLEQ